MCFLELGMNWNVRSVVKKGILMIVYMCELHITKFGIVPGGNLITVTCCLNSPIFGEVDLAAINKIRTSLRTSNSVLGTFEFLMQILYAYVNNFDMFCKAQTNQVMPLASHENLYLLIRHIKVTKISKQLVCVST